MSLPSYIYCNKKIWPQLSGSKKEISATCPLLQEFLLLLLQLGHDIHHDSLWKVWKGYNSTLVTPEQTNSRAESLQRCVNLIRPVVERLEVVRFGDKSFVNSGELRRFRGGGRHCS